MSQRDDVRGFVPQLRRRWSLEIGPPLHHDGVSWVAPAVRSDGTAAVLKIGMPHYEAEHEIDGLRLWDGNPTVRLYEADESLGAMLLERCVPGTALRNLLEPEQDVVIATLLRRLWRRPPSPHPFRTLAEMLQRWSGETMADIDHWPDAALVREGLGLFDQLSRSAPAEVLLATDLHAGNVLRSEREPWLIIDPKPFVGDPAYDATQHLLNCTARLLADPRETVRRFADILGLDYDRLQMWTFARAAAGPRRDWKNAELLALARCLAP